MMWHKLLIGLFLTFSVVIVRGASDPAGPGIPALQSNSEYVALRDQDSRLQVRIDEMQTRIAGLRAVEVKAVCCVLQCCFSPLVQTLPFLKIGAVLRSLEKFQGKDGTRGVGTSVL